MSSNARKILVVDDDPWVGKLVEFVARDLNFDPILARDGAEALDLFGEQLPDVVVLDVVLPKVDGIEVARRIKTTGPGAFTPVVIVSGIYRGDPETMAKARAEAFFGKPLSPEMLGRRFGMLFPPPAKPLPAAPLPPATAGEVAFTAQPVAMALARAHQRKATGILHVRTRGVRAELSLREGSLISVQSEAWEEPLAAMLQRVQRITPEKRAHLDRLVSSKAEPDFAHALAKSGSITADELQKVLATQQMHRVTEAFAWTEGFHRFVEEPVSGSQVDLETASLVHWGLRRMAVPQRALDDALPSMTGPLVREAAADPVLRILPLSRAEKWLLSQANGKSSFQEAWNQVRDDKTAADTLTRAVLALRALGAIDVPLPKPSPAPALQERLAKLPTLEPAPSRPMFGTPASILLKLWREKVTGVLVIDLEDESIAIYLKDGQLVGLRPPDLERLESLLVKRGKIRADILPQLRLLLAAGRNIGDALVELQAISLVQLHAFIRGELRVALRDLSRRKRVETEFTASPLSAQDLVRHEWDTGLAVIESVRSLELAYVRTALPPMDALIQRDSGAEDLLQLLTLSPTERNLFTLLGSAQPRERLETIGLVSEAEQTRALWVLLAVGLARQVEAALAPIAPPEPIEEDVVVDDDYVKVVEPEPLPSFEDVTPAEFHSTAPQPTIREAVQAAKSALPAIPMNDSLPGAQPRRRMTVPRSRPPSGEGPVTRAEYERLLDEKRELEERLEGLVEQQNHGVMNRELFEQLIAERNELKAQMVALAEEVVALKSSGAFIPTAPPPAASSSERGSFPPEGDFSDGGVIAFKRTRR